jgi:hypothetical protein
MCRFQATPRVEETIWVTFEMKAGPLSDCKVQGNPKQGIMSLIKWVDTMSADSPVVGKAPTHPEKCQPRSINI